MEILGSLLIKVVPLSILILLGYIAGKFFKVEKKAIAPLLIYIISPLIIFNGIINTELNLANLSLPVLFFILACLISTLIYISAKKVWKDTTRNILAFTSGTGNTGYFGLPVAIALFGDQITGLVVLSVLGFVTYENTLGYFLTAKGNFSTKEALKKLLSLPALYAFIFGLVINFLNVDFGENYTILATNFKGAYTVLGMMLIGLGISDIKVFKIDWMFISLSFLTKFLIWPALILFVIFLDNQILRVWSETEHSIMLLMSAVPLAANTVAYATELKTEPEKAAIAVLLSTIWGIVYIPIVVTIFL